jgi:hypothetical protein
MHSIKKQAAFQFVLDELMPIRPIIKQMFGFTYVYLDEKLLLALRDANKKLNTNGIWIFTEAEHLESLRLEFPALARQSFWKSGTNGWVILAAKNENFEEYAFRVCELILLGDRRFGRMTRGSWKRPSPKNRPRKTQKHKKQIRLTH